MSFMKQESEIHLLPSDVVDQIAAGEVVERPSHLVKELIENALDAGSTQIHIEVFDSGRRVRVSDNGFGIVSKSLAKSLDRFTTSKITATKDLWNLSSFGFRGEALASIAAVSDLTITSRPAGAETAHQIKSEFGKKQEVVPVSRDVGTTVEVQDLFANVPARLKFLKSGAAEIQQLKIMCKAMALTAPEVEYKFFVDNELHLFFPKAASNFERAQQVLELSDMLFTEYQTEGVKLRACLSTPSQTNKTSRQLWFFVNQRWVQDRTLQAAVMDAYRSLLMHGEYPSVVLWLDVAKDEVDVNIHPTKSQVKFLKTSEVFKCVQQGLRKKLEEGKIIFQSAPEDIGAAEVAKNFYGNLSFQSPEMQEVSFPQKELFFDRVEDDSSVAEPEFNIEISKVTGGFWGRLEVLAQLHLTYILAQSENSFFIVDQHAAHERVAFETLIAAFRGGKIDKQGFLFPMTMDLSADQCEALLTQSSELLKMGIEIERSGPQSISINSSPSLLKESALMATLQKLAVQIVELGGSFAMDKKIIDLCASMACHSVVRAGQALSREEMKSLLQQMDQFPLSGFCPHGRPVHIEIPIAKIEKDFGRVL